MWSNSSSLLCYFILYFFFFYVIESILETTLRQPLLISSILNLSTCRYFQLCAATILHCHHENSPFLFLLEFTHSCFQVSYNFGLFIHWAGAYPLTAFLETMCMRETLKDFKYFNWIYDWYKFSAKSSFLLEFLKTVLSSRTDILLSLLLIHFLVFVP